jgi:hypothetical protein
VKTAPKPAPSLLTGSTVASSDLPEMRILAKLEGAPPVKTRTKSQSWFPALAWYILLALALICSIAYFVLRTAPARKESTDTIITRTEPPANKSAPIHEHRAIAASAAPANDSVAVAATIVEEKIPATSTAFEPDSPRQTESAGALTQALESAPPARPAPKKTNSTRAAAPATRSRATPATVKRETRRPSASITAKQEPANSATNSKQNDTDVDLLAALMAHSKQPSTAISATGTASHLPAPASTSGNNTLAANTTRLKQVVLRTQTLSTSDLVRQCGELGWLEGWLCKRRICSELWDKDPACFSTSRAAN